MAKAQLKLLLFIIVLGITLGCMATAYYIYAKVLKPETRIQREIETIKKVERPMIDPGLKRFEAAVALIKQGQIEPGREALYKLIQQFPESPTCTEAKRIIGEINMDMLFSPNHKVGKKDYIVQPGDSLNLIASKNNTTVDMIIRLNGLMGTTLQPGDHLTLIPLDFSVVVDVSDKTFQLLRKVGEDKFAFFKEYHALDVRLPAGLRPPAEMQISGKSAVVDGKPVPSSDPAYINAEKWFAGSRTGVVIRTPRPPKAVPVPEAPVKAGIPSIEAAPALEIPPEAGIFLAREDLEEMFALVRTGSKLAFRR